MDSLVDASLACIPNEPRDSTSTSLSIDEEQVSIVHESYPATAFTIELPCAPFEYAIYQRDYANWTSFGSEELIPLQRYYFAGASVRTKVVGLLAGIAIDASVSVSHAHLVVECKPVAIRIVDYAGGSAKRVWMYLGKAGSTFTPAFPRTPLTQSQ